MRLGKYNLTRSAAFVGLAGLVVGLSGLGIVLSLVRPPAPPAARPAAKSAVVAVAPDPLTLAAIKARTYPASPLTPAANLGDQGGYSDIVVSYLSDGLTIYALMSTPAGPAPSGGWPVIILNHGYIDPTQYQTAGPEYRQFIAALAQAGYMVVKPDYRGNGQSQGIAEGAYFSPVYTYDLLNLISALKSSRQINPGRIGLLGHSMGGAVVQRAMVISPDIKATVLMAGVVGSMYDIFYNWPHTFIYSDRPPGLQERDRQALVQKYGDPKANPAFWDSVSAINYVKDIRGPVQVNQDTGDSRVPQLFADHFVGALQAAGKSVEYHLYPGDDHQFAASRTRLLQNILAFYRANL